MGRKQNIAILILAAGESSRMKKKAKQLLSWENTSLLGNALKQAQTSIAAGTYVVLGANADSIKREISIDPSIAIQNRDWRKGMGSSIAVGVKHISSCPERYDAVLLMLADQPLIDTGFINVLLHSWMDNPTSIVATSYPNGVGVPAVFGESLFCELMRLDQNQGAKTIIDTYKKDILSIDPEGKEVDIDTWSDYQNLLNRVKVKN
jgi:molybdenum cofactor cytidylyltransferase